MRLLAAAIALAVVLPPTGARVHAADNELFVVGVVIPDNGGSRAAIEDPTAARARFYAVGDSVNGGVVTAIAPDRVTIAYAGQPIVVRLAGVPLAGDGRERPSPQPAESVSAPREGQGGPSGLYGQIGALLPKPARGPAGGTGRGKATGGGTGGGSSAGGGGAAGTTGSSSHVATLQLTGVLHGGTEQPGDQFSGQSIRDLLISVTHTNLSASSQRIDLVTPEGGLYQKYSGDATPASQVRVPIGGTWITERGLFGEWTVRVYLDRDPLPVATTAFTLSR